MLLVRRFIATLLILTGVLWGGSLYLLGMQSLAYHRAGETPTMLGMALWLGVFLILTGNFVFMLLADRVLRIKRRALLDGVELVVAGGMFLSVAVFISMWLLQAPNGTP